jgi:hypothetical protein
MSIRTLDGHLPHPDYKGWEGFLKECKIAEIVDDVTHYYSSNCNYILFPKGILITNFGFNGNALMNRVKEKGAENVITQIKKDREKMSSLFAAIKEKDYEAARKHLASIEQSKEV